MTVDKLILPKDYYSRFSVIETEIAIKKIKDYFEQELAKNLSLTRVSAPLIVKASTGLNDDLNGVERKVNFDIPKTNDNIEIVQSLAKWKRMALKKYRFDKGTGLYTDMNAIRRDEELDNIHSIYVDQWDWEKIIGKEERTLDKLKEVVKLIYKTFLDTEKRLEETYPFLKNELPEELTFITSQELLDRYPKLTAKEREYNIAKEHKAVFIMQIGDKLSDGTMHDGRSADYDDWKLNGDLIFYYKTLDIALELSSMGIRVDKDALLYQLTERNQLYKTKFDFHKEIIDEELPYSIGGGIGQSRICMFFMQKAHIGEVQSAIWPQEMIDTCSKNGIHLL